MMRKHSIYPYLEDFLLSKDNPTIFELGVHWAEDTSRILSWCKNTPKYHGFEPDLRNIKIAEKNIAHYDMPVKLVHGAISDKVGKTTLYLSDGTHEESGNRMTGANSIRKPKEVKNVYDWIDFNETQAVRTYTIDKYCSDNKIQHIDFIWSDIQGCEYDMIIGAKKMLPNIELMLLEYSDMELYEGQKGINEIMQLLGKNWTVIAKSDDDILVRQKL